VNAFSEKSAERAFTARQILQGGKIEKPPEKKQNKNGDLQENSASGAKRRINGYNITVQGQRDRPL